MQGIKKNKDRSKRIYCNTDLIGISSTIENVLLNDNNVLEGLFSANVVNYLDNIEKNALLSERQITLVPGITHVNANSVGTIFGLDFDLTISSENPAFNVDITINWQYCTEILTISGLAPKGEFLKLTLLAARPILQVDTSNSVIDSGFYQICLNYGLPLISCVNSGNTIVGSLSYLSPTEKEHMKRIRKWAMTKGVRI